MKNEADITGDGICRIPACLRGTSKMSLEWDRNEFGCERKEGIHQSCPPLQCNIAKGQTFGISSDNFCREGGKQWLPYGGEKNWM